MSGGLRALSRRVQDLVDPGQGGHAQVAQREAARPGRVVSAVGYVTGEGASTVVHRRIVIGVGEHGFGAEFL
jgi:hypothetical protein